MPSITSEEELLLSQDENHLIAENFDEKVLKRNIESKTTLYTIIFLATVLVLSLAGNLALALRYTSTTKAVRQCTSPLASLVPDSKVPFAVPSYYGSGANITLTDELWSSTRTEAGMIALPKSPTLHPTETFPWDPSKGVYMLNGYHGLHCLKLLYTSIRQYQISTPQTQPFEHIVHCIGALRADIMCTADDTPRFAGDPMPGDSFEQVRTCRDWGRLERWAESHSACFKRVNINDPRYETLHEWKSCPEGSPYQNIVEEYFRDKGGLSID